MSALTHNSLTISEKPTLETKTDIGVGVVGTGWYRRSDDRVGQKVNCDLLHWQKWLNYCIFLSIKTVSFNFYGKSGTKWSKVE